MRATNAVGDSEYSNTAEATTDDLVARFFATDDNSTIYSNYDSKNENTVYSTGGLVVGCNGMPLSGYFFEMYSCTKAALHFEFTELAGRDILQAVLQLTPSTLPEDSDTTYQASAFASSWSTTTLTDKTLPNSYVYGASTVNAPTRDGPLSWDVTLIVRQWVSGQWANNDIFIGDTKTPLYPSTTSRYTAFYSTDFFNMDDSRPQILVRYK